MSIKRDQTNRNEQSKVYIHFSSLLIFLYASLKIITLFIYLFLIHSSVIQCTLLYAVLFFCAVCYSAEKTVVYLMAGILAVAVIMWAAAWLCSLFSLFTIKMRRYLKQRMMFYTFCIANIVEAACYLSSALQQLDAIKIIGLCLSVFATIASIKGIRAASRRSSDHES